MTIDELNKIIERDHTYPVFVSELAYREVEELYLESYYTLKHGIEKSQIGNFYQKFDYQGVRNALEILHNYKVFREDVVENVVLGKKTNVSPSQFEYLKLIGWQVEKLNFEISCPWIQ